MLSIVDIRSFELINPGPDDPPQPWRELLDQAIDHARARIEVTLGDIVVVDAKGSRVLALVRYQCAEETCEVVRFEPLPHY